MQANYICYVEVIITRPAHRLSMGDLPHMQRVHFLIYSCTSDVINIQHNRALTKSEFAHVLENLKNNK